VIYYDYKYLSFHLSSTINYGISHIVVFCIFYKCDILRLQIFIFCANGNASTILLRVPKYKKSTNFWSSFLVIVSVIMQSGWVKFDPPHDSKLTLKTKISATYHKRSVPQIQLKWNTSKNMTTIMVSNRITKCTLQPSYCVNKYVPI
jgi:hypothetical protein